MFVGGGDKKGRGEAYNHGSATNADTGKNSTSQDGCQISVLCDQHNASAEHEYCSEDPQTLSAAKEEGGGVSEQRSEKGTSLVNGNDIRLDGGQMMGLDVFESEFRDETWESECCSDESRIITNHA